MHTKWARVRFFLVVVALSALCVPYTIIRATAEGQVAAKAMLAVVGTDGNLSIYDANGTNPFALTTDAKAGEKTYAWPTWSTDGRLAFFGINAGATNPYSLGVFIVDQVKQGAAFNTAYTSKDEIFTYAYWAPADCASKGPGGNCRDLTLLFTPPDSSAGLGLRLIRDQNGKFTDKEIGRAAPFYYSFSPDAKQMLWHRADQEFGIYDVAENKVVQTLDDTPGQFQAPMWSPQDDRLLVGTQGINADQTNIVIAQGKNRQVLLPDQNSPVSFAWSPDAKLVASVAAFDTLIVTDASTGKQLAASPESSVVSYFWSPQSDRVAYIAVTREQPGGAAKIRSNGHNPVEQSTAALKWFVLDVKTGLSTGLEKFTPTRDMVYLLNFFDQFSRSHSLWSPDGRYLVYAAADPATSQNVLLIDTQNLSSSPIQVGSGTFGVWSWR